MRGRLRDFSTTHILGLIFRHELIIAISNGVLNCISHYKLMPGQPKPLRNFSWYTESDWRQSHRHIYRTVPPLCAMHRNNCSEMWKVELVRAQIDHRSLFLLYSQWQQSRDVLLYHSVLQHSRESIDHSGHHHRSCGMCCASYPFWCHHLAVNSHTTKTNSAQLLLPLDTCSFSNQRLSCSTVHYQVSRRDFRDPVAHAASSSHWPLQVAAFQTDSSPTVCKNVNPKKTAGAVPSLLCCFSGHSAFQ